MTEEEKQPLTRKCSGRTLEPAWERPAYGPGGGGGGEGGGDLVCASARRIAY